ncbi:hypothetical protein PSYPI_17857 [Pseudomonas syringae pv. pisi str. 1704B]|uniref:Uncharacterized protein n=1 Tax=Pseudomonas syringae pv. pisi str. 1704B TaxID=629263 RepID=F3GAP9_PSESJ|nr:hypothetical protein PSYPI_17857 [Pseudomonas syringae pv. pisi str. 1704B]
MKLSDLDKSKVTEPRLCMIGRQRYINENLP